MMNKKDCAQIFNSLFSSYYGSSDKFQIKNSEPAIDNIKVIDSDIGRAVDFKRIAVHHMVLPAGCRTSSPHAESHEEEFVFVVKGHPHLWLNGFIHELKPGSSVGFPAGTGIAHTFINNTSEDVHLIVAGEKTKKENLCFFPIDPQLKETCQIWWADAPVQTLGSHPGRPGPILENHRASLAADCVVHCFEEPLGKPFHYPGDNETFGQGFRISTKVGLKKLGIWFETLPPGRRAAFPHAHTHEDEFIFVVKGEPTLWLDGYVQKLKHHDFAAFPANTGISHTLINDTNENINYLCIGEAIDFPDEKILYPLNPLRIEECQRKGWYWDEFDRSKRPQMGASGGVVTEPGAGGLAQFGPHNGRPEKIFPDHMFFKIVEKSDRHLVLKIIFNQFELGSVEILFNSNDKSYEIQKLKWDSEEPISDVKAIFQELLNDYLKRAWDREKLI